MNGARRKNRNLMAEAVIAAEEDFLEGIEGNLDSRENGANPHRYNASADNFGKLLKSMPLSSSRPEMV